MKDKVEIRLFANLRDGRERQYFLDVSSVQEVLAKLDIQETDAHFILINGKHSNITSQLKPGDLLSIFPQVGGG